MKRINILLGAIFLLFAVSCNRKIEFPHDTFITFDVASVSASEGSGTVSIPVSIYNPTGEEIQVTVKAVDGDGNTGAKEGVNYNIISPYNGVLTFSGQTVTQDIEIELIPVEGITGTKSFYVQIASATGGVNVGGYNEALVKILDDDHPLKDFIGEWSGSIREYYSSSYNTTFIVEAVEGNNSKLKIDSGIDPVLGKGSKVKYSASVEIGEDGEYEDVLTISSKQLNGYDNCFLSALNMYSDGTIDFADYISFRLNGKTLTLETNYGVIVPDEASGGYGLYAIYQSGATFTKK